MGSSSPLFSRSIFAQELAHILSSHGKTLSDLTRTPVNLDRKKVQVLEASLHNLSRMPALNFEEINTIVFKLNLSPEERLSIFAALIALGVQRLLLFYLLPERTYQIAEELRQAAFALLKHQYNLGNDAFRGVPQPGQTMQEASAWEDVLLAALTAYDEGTALATLGQASTDLEAGLALFQQAQLFYTRALARLDRMPKQAQATEDWSYWRDEVQHALETTQEELE